MADVRDRWGNPVSLPTRVCEVAQRQGGAISTGQLNALGLHGDQIARLVDSTWLVRAQYRAYLVTGHPRTARGRLHVALFTYGEQSALTGRAAAVARGLISDLGATVHVVLPTSRRARPGIRPHRTTLCEGEVVDVGRLRCVSVPLMLLDLAAQEPASLLPVVVRKAGEKGLLDRKVLSTALDRHRRHPGAHRVREALTVRDPNRGETRSALERRLTDFLVEYGFPPADRNFLLHLDDGEVLTLADFVWGWACCCLEADHRSTHDGEERFDEDRRISRRLMAAGWSTPRCTGADLDAPVRRDALAAEMWAILLDAVARWWTPADGAPTRQRES